MAWIGLARAGFIALAAACAAAPFAHDDPVLDEAVTLAALPPGCGAEATAGRAEAPVC